MTEIWHLLIVIAVLAVLAWLVIYFAVPAPFKWFCFAIIFIVALAALLPFIGVHLPA